MAEGLEKPRGKGKKRKTKSEVTTQGADTAAQRRRHLQALKASKNDKNEVVDEESAPRSIKGKRKGGKLAVLKQVKATKKAAAKKKAKKLTKEEQENPLDPESELSDEEDEDEDSGTTLILGQTEPTKKKKEKTTPKMQGKVKQARKTRQAE